MQGRGGKVRVFGVIGEVREGEIDWGSDTVWSGPAPDAGYCFLVVAMGAAERGIGGLASPVDLLGLLLGSVLSLWILGQSIPSRWASDKHDLLWRDAVWWPHLVDCAFVQRKRCSFCLESFWLVSAPLSSCMVPSRCVQNSHLNAAARHS